MVRRDDICPVIKKPFNCQDCRVPDMDKDGKCPIMKGDDFIEQTIKSLRKVIENEKK